jgi:hypothetical protein
MTINHALKRLISKESESASTTAIPQGATVPPLIAALADDAKKNASGLPGFANRCQAKADRLAVSAGALSAATSLSIWATLQQTPAWWAKVVVASAALVAAILALLTRIYNWGGVASEARQLASKYGHLYGDLLEIEGKLLAGKAVSDDKIGELRVQLENLKDGRQKINAELDL